MTLLHVGKTQVHVWKIPRCRGMNGVSVGHGLSTTFARRLTGA